MPPSLFEMENLDHVQSECGAMPGEELKDSTQNTKGRRRIIDEQLAQVIAVGGIAVLDLLWLQNDGWAAKIGLPHAMAWVIAILFTFAATLLVLKAAFSVGQRNHRNTAQCTN